MNVVLDLPSEIQRARVWVFDPRRIGEDAARYFAAGNLDQVDDVLAEIVRRTS